MKKLKLFLLASLSFIVVVVITYVFFIRPWHIHWGATAQEIATTFPGDKFIAPNWDISTRAITIHAPAAVVWQWLVQIGQGRGGFYSHDWLENLFAADMRNANQIKPELQDLKPGDKLLWAKYGSTIDAASTQIALVDPGRALVIRGGWGMYLYPIDSQTTRLIVRYPLDPNIFGVGILTYGIFEPAHFVMESGMMLGIKERAEKYQ